MLTAYFKHPFTLRKLRAGPAGPYLDDFASHLAEAGYSRDKIRAYLRGTGRLSAWAAQADLTVGHLDSRVLGPFGRYLDSQGRLRGRRGEHSATFLGARHFVDFLEARGLVATPAAAGEPALVTEFCHWMRSQRGVTETTLNGYRPALRRLLVALGDQPEQYTATQLRGFVLSRAGAHKTGQVKTSVTVLRMFLRFLITQGRCPPELLVAIPTIAGWRRASLPSYLGPEEIERVIGTCDPMNAMGARDRAVLLLLARLGLRASDVAALARLSGFFRCRCVKFHAASFASAIRCSKAASSAVAALVSEPLGAAQQPWKSCERPGRRRRASSLVKNSATRLPRSVIS